MGKYGDYFSDSKRKSTPRYAIEEQYHTRDSKTALPYYTFKVPPTWHGIPSTNKSIGLRRFHCAPRTYSMRFLIRVYKENGDFENAFPIEITCTQDNLTAEIMQCICDNFNKAFHYYINSTYPNIDESGNEKDNDPVTLPNLKYTLIKEEGKTFRYEIRLDNKHSDSPVPTLTKFSITEAPNDQAVDTYGYENFNRFFNQPLSQTYPIAAKQVLDNIWDRKTLYVHSDIASHTNRSFLCMNGDFYYSPSKIYVFTNPSTEFRVWVSFDGREPATLLHENFILELCFMADVNDNYAT